MKTKIFTLGCMFMASIFFGQQNFWTKKTGTVQHADLKMRKVQPKQFQLYQLKLDDIKSQLANVPQRFSSDESHLITFPDADGKFRKYVVQEASVMEDGLQAKYPDLRSYVGWEKNNPQNSIRFSVTPELGMNIMYFDGWEVSYMDSYTKDNSTYIVYKRQDLPPNDRFFECKVEGEIQEAESNGITSKAPLVTDGQFRKYRLALAATGEYTAYYGGTVRGAMAGMVNTMTRVNGVYEKTISTTMVMVTNNDQLVYTNASTDPYTNNDGSTMLGQNQTTIDTKIGSANYDIGHVFSTGGGGVAYLGCVCTSIKAGGVTGSGAPIGDPFDIDYVAHEMGHQFGASHTFRAATGSCSGNASNATAFEPGSGTTVMAYAGICPGNNVQNNSDPYFHAASVTQMYAVITRASDCSVKTPNNNLVPTAEAGADYIIPKSTAFVLTGVGSDPDGNPITYLWEQYDSQSNTQPPVSTNTNGPVFRSYLPTVSPTRYVPVMSSILAGNLTPQWEVMPSVARILNFNLLVNDNKATGNQAAKDQMKITVTADGPFKVTSHTTNTQYVATLPTTVTWDVAGTNAGTINTQNVSVLLTKDNGATWTAIASGVPNNGSASVMLPNEDIAVARLMVKADNNIYFAVNSSNFSVKKGNMATVDSKTRSLTVFPNPAKNEVNVVLKNKSEVAQYTVYDVTGRVIKNGNLSPDGKIMLDKISNGNYILSVELKNGEKFSEKLMIKK